MHFLVVHFKDTLRVRFFLDGYPIRHEELFDPRFALAPIAQSADMASQMIYGRRIVADMIDDLDAAFQKEVVLKADLQSVDLVMLIAAAEEFFQIDKNTQTQNPFNVDLRHIISSMTMV